MINRLRKLDWSFIRGSSMMSLGIAVARILGFAFWFVLARLFDESDTGYVRYVITLAEVVAIGTMPFSQHVFAWFISKHKDNKGYLSDAMSNGWLILLIIFAGTLLFATPVLLAVGRFDISIIVVFAGLTLFYTYFGLARGYLESGRLLGAYLGSNFVQIVAVILAVLILGTESTLPVLLIYGLSYLLPIVFLQWRYPLPIYFKIKRPDFKIIRTLLKFSGPIWLSHTLYTLFLAVDIIMLESFIDEAAVGVYTITRTLSSVFHFIPWGIEMMLMPRVAASDPTEHRRLLRNAFGLIIVVNTFVFVGYVLFYRLFIDIVVGEEYFAGMPFAIVMAIGAILFGFQGIVSSVLVGKSQPQFESMSRFVILVVTTVFGFILVPGNDALGISTLLNNLLGIDSSGIMGMAIAVLLGVVGGLGVYVILFILRRATAKRKVQLAT